MKDKKKLLIALPVAFGAMFGTEYLLTKANEPETPTTSYQAPVVGEPENAQASQPVEEDAPVADVQGAQTTNKKATAPSQSPQTTQSNSTTMQTPTQQTTTPPPSTNNTNNNQSSRNDSNNDTIVDEDTPPSSEDNEQNNNNVNVD